MPEKLTVLIPCRNERRNIYDCIESIRPIADEILVADSGSTDGTLAIVRRAGGCRILQHPWTGYARFKNRALKHASHPWILIVDADERLTPELIAEIRAMLADPPDGVDAFSVRFKTYFMGHLLRFSSWNNPAVRLIRRGRCRYIASRVHERMNAAPERTGHLRGRLLHYSFWSYDEFFAKYTRYSRMCAEELHERGKRPSIYGLLIRPFLRFFQLYILKGGFLDGAPGIQVCMLMAFFYSFSKRARLWEMWQVAEPERPRQAAVSKVPDAPMDEVVPLGVPARRAA